MDYVATDTPAQADDNGMPSFLVRAQPPVVAEQQEPAPSNPSASARDDTDLEMPESQCEPAGTTPTKRPPRLKTTRERIVLKDDVSNWRKLLPIHPACADYRDLEPDKLRELGNDILAAGELRVPVAVLINGPQIWLLDGKNRLDAMALVGVSCSLEITEKWEKGVIRLGFNVHRFLLRTDIHRDLDDDKARHVAASLNAHRRHLTAEQRRDAIANLLKSDPSKSDRDVGRAANVDGKTVAAVRQELEARAEIPHVETRTDTKGRAQPAKKKAKAKAALAARAEQKPKPESALPEAARIESEQLDNVTKNADFSADVVVKSPPTAPDDAESPLEILCAEWARSKLKCMLDDLEPEDQAKFLDYLETTTA